jgi:hypothetical protein
MSGIDAQDDRRIDLVKMAVTRTGEYIRLWMRREILARHGISLDEFLLDAGLANRHEIVQEIAEESIATQMIIGGFSKSGSPFLLFTDCVNVQEQTNPGRWVSASLRRPSLPQAQWWVSGPQSSGT